MYKRFDNIPDTNDAIKILKEDGIFIVKDFVDHKDIRTFREEVKSLCLNSGGHYEFGRNYRGGDLDSHKNSPTLHKYYSSGWIEKVTQEFTGEDGKIDRIFATYDYISGGKLARNGYLHFDRQHCLKFFIYLDDINESNGAFTCCIGSNKDGYKLRKDSWEKSDEYQEVKNRPELDFPEIAKKYKQVPIEEKAGTLIIFETDTFHKGGEVLEGNERLVVRSHKYLSKNG